MRPAGAVGRGEGAPTTCDLGFDRLEPSKLPTATVDVMAPLSREVDSQAASRLDVASDAVSDLRRRARPIRWTLAAIVIGGLCAWYAHTFIWSLEPPLPPDLPADVEVVVNQTEYSTGAGGSSGRLLILRSATRSSEEVAHDVIAGFDRDPRWQRDGGVGTDEEWWWERVPCSDQLTWARVWVAEAGEDADVGQYNSVPVPERSAVVNIQVHASEC